MCKGKRFLAEAGLILYIGFYFININLVVLTKNLFVQTFDLTALQN